MNGLRFFTVCPPNTRSFGVGEPIPSSEYRDEVRRHAEWADNHDIRGMVMYSFAQSLDPWAAASYMLECTERLRPIVTVMPFHIHPYVLVRAIASLTYIHGRGIDLNIVAGASPDELTSLGQSTDSKHNYARMCEFVTTIRGLIDGEMTYEGDHYRLVQAAVRPEIPADARPEIFIPGSSENAAPVVRRVADSSLLTAKPLAVLQEEVTRLNGDRRDLGHTVIVGLVARPTADAAWTYVREQHLTDKRGRLVSRMFVARSSSGQHRANVELAEQREVYDENLWYGAAKIGIDCPKLVGSYDEVRARLAAYREIGVNNILIDLPDRLEEYDHIAEVIHG